jgi:hypothetical protein
MIKSAHIYITQYARNEASIQEKLIYISKAVCEYEDITVLWNQWVQIYREVLVNGPDIITEYKTDQIYLLTDIATPSDRNLIQKEAERKLKYKILSTEIQRMWNMKCFIIPVIIGVTGILTKRIKIS